MDRWLGAPGIAGDAARFRKEYTECLAEAAKAGSKLAKGQCLLFADEWLKLALAAEAEQLAAANDPAPCK